MEFDWHDGKNGTLLKGRGFGFADVLPIFAGRTVEWQDTRAEYGEIRMVAIGRHPDGRFFTVIYTDRGGVRWLITAWPSHKKERKLWQG